MSFPLSRLLDIKNNDLEKVLYFASYIITSVNEEARREDEATLRDDLAVREVGNLVDADELMQLLD